MTAVGGAAVTVEEAVATRERLNILLCSVPFRPSLGGLETVSAILAERFHALGHSVVLLTQTPAEETDDAPYTIVRRPSARALFRWVKWADVVLHNNVSLRFAWPQLLLRRPWVVAHHMWTPRSGAGAFAGRLKHWAFGFAGNIAVSRAMAESVRAPSTVIPNPYAEDLFRTLPDVVRDRDLVFLGRLVPLKGAEVLLDALAVLAKRGRYPQLTVIGTGPLEADLRRRAAGLGLGERVRFAGPRRGPELVRMLNAHRVIVVPSVWEEPFGVVALEGLACGCAPIVTRSGGLPDAVGPCGVVVPKNDSASLADAIDRLLSDEHARAALLTRAPEHLAQHTRARVARRYLEIMAGIRSSSKAPGVPLASAAAATTTRSDR